MSEFDLILKNVNEILTKKGKDYGDASFELGLKGNFVHLWDKVKRLKTLVWEGKKANVENESIRDTLNDIIGYGAIGIRIIDLHENKVKEDCIKNKKSPYLKGMG